MATTATAAASSGTYNVPIYDPGLWTGTILHDVLAAAGVQGTGQVRRADNDDPGGDL